MSDFVLANALHVAVLVFVPPLLLGVIGKTTAQQLFGNESPVGQVVRIKNVPFMWEPYAALHYLHKPVELIILNTEEHVLTNPAVRLASQGGSVDWFRFWLQGYEDPNPSKAEQYQRWREMRKMQAESAKANASSN